VPNRDLRFSGRRDPESSDGIDSVLPVCTRGGRDEVGDAIGEEVNV